jgi:hypothetical protein
LIFTFISIPIGLFVPLVMVQAAVDSGGGGGVLICKFREAERQKRFGSFFFTRFLSFFD